MMPPRQPHSCSKRKAVVRSQRWKTQKHCLLVFQSGIRVPEKWRYRVQGNVQSSGSCAGAESTYCSFWVVWWQMCKFRMCVKCLCVKVFKQNGTKKQQAQEFHHVYFLWEKGQLIQNTVCHTSAYYCKAVFLSILLTVIPPRSLCRHFSIFTPPSNETLVLQIQPIFVHVSLLTEREKDFLPPTSQFSLLWQDHCLHTMCVAQSPGLDPQLQVHNVHISMTAGTVHSRRFFPSTSPQFVFPAQQLYTLTS